MSFVEVKQKKEILKTIRSNKKKIYLLLNQRNMV